MTEIDALAQKMFTAVKGYVAKAVAVLDARIAELDALIRSIPSGEKGDPGEPGKPGERGEKGEQGKDGANGKDGAPGRDGKDGAPGERGEKGDPGVGIKGERGEKGADGERGEPGRDAAELDILPSIDEDKSYRRGTWASHCGGLIRAARETDPVKDGDLVGAGWVVMVEGLAAIVVAPISERLFSVSTLLTSGTKAVTEFRIPVVDDKGVYRTEAEYMKGDGVTWAGSWWIAQVDKPTDKPGISEQWRLAVKRGRDGKDSK